MKAEEHPLDLDSMENGHRVAYLIAGHIRKTLTPPERRELDVWLEASEQHIALFEELTDEANIQKAMEWYANTNPDAAIKRVRQRLRFKPAKATGTLRLLPLSIAASIVVAISLGVFFLARQKSSTDAPIPVAEATPIDRPPGGNKAVLTLADGSKVVLDKTGNGTLATEGNTAISKSDSSLAYTTQGSPTGVAYNILETPPGGEFKIVLSDGTTVWLNAASRLRYPASFGSGERIVELNGEAYFEVRHDARQPFKVKVGEMILEDLGTSFNVNSYRDEGAVKTTLVEGLVKVMSGGSFKMLKPGQEALVSDGNIAIVDADTEAATGWRRNEFVFHRTPMATVLKSLERWYGIEIHNKNSNDNHLIATFKRDVPLTRMLYYLEKTGDVHFEWKGKDLIALP